MAEDSRPRARLGPRACRVDGRCRRRDAGQRGVAEIAAQSADRKPDAESAQSAPHLRRYRARRAGAIDPRTRHHPADRGALGALGGKQFEIIAGERRWRASQRAGLHEVPVVVLEVSDAEALELAIIENIQRADLNPLEEAAGYQALANQYSHSQDDIAHIVGKSRSHVANTLRLLKLPDTVKNLHQRRQAHRRSCARADQPARSGNGRARHRREGAQRPAGREAAARHGECRQEEKQVERQGAQGCRYRRARKAAVGRAWSGGRNHRSRPRRRRARHSLPHARSARRSRAAAGAALGPQNLYCRLSRIWSRDLIFD